MTDQPDQAAEATSLLCFSTPAGGGPPIVRICLGGSPPWYEGPRAAARAETKYSFTVHLTNVTVSLPNPLVGTAPPIQGLVNVKESLKLSVEDLKAMQACLSLILAGDAKQR